MAVTPPALGVDDATVVGAQGDGVAVVVPDVGTAILVEVPAVVAADAGVDADLTVAGQADVAEAVGVAVSDPSQA